MKNKKDFGSQLKSRLYVFFGFFIVSLIGGVYSIRVPSFIGYSIIALTFMIFNGFMILYNILLELARSMVKCQQ